jgi:hypothetical protein
MEEQSVGMAQVGVVGNFTTYFFNRGIAELTNHIHLFLSLEVLEIPNTRRPTTPVKPRA